MMAILNPTVNAYRRIHAEALVPDARVLGARSSHDARSRPARARRCDADRDARSATEPRTPTWPAPSCSPPASTGSRASWSRRRRSRASSTTCRRTSRARRCPTSFADALAALEADPVLRDALGGPADRDLQDDQGVRARALPDLGDATGSSPSTRRGCSAGGRAPSRAATSRSPARMALALAREVGWWSGGMRGRRSSSTRRRVATLASYGAVIARRRGRSPRDTAPVPRRRRR